MLVSFKATKFYTTDSLVWVLMIFNEGVLFGILINL